MKRRLISPIIVDFVLYISNILTKDRTAFHENIRNGMNVVLLCFSLCLLDLVWWVCYIISAHKSIEAQTQLNNPERLRNQIWTFFLSFIQNPPKTGRAFYFQRVQRVSRQTTRGEIHHAPPVEGSNLHGIYWHSDRSLRLLFQVQGTESRWIFLTKQKRDIYNWLSSVSLSGWWLKCLQTNRGQRGVGKYKRFAVSWKGTKWNGYRCLAIRYLICLTLDSFSSLFYIADTAILWPVQGREIWHMKYARWNFPCLL